jgi:DNA-binding LacI/PurR family transcriptional regulator
MNQTKKPTIADVAKAAGVSKAAVTFALKGTNGVSAETRERILAVADDLGWTPSASARALSNRRAYALGFIIRRDPTVLAADPFFADFIAGAEEVLADGGRVMVLSVARDEASERASYRSLASEGRVDGVLITDLRTDDERFALLSELELPAVVASQTKANHGFPSVHEDDEGGVAEVVDHLVQFGHTRIAHVTGDPAYEHAVRRRESFVAALKRHGLRPDAVVESDFTANGGAEATRHLLSRSTQPSAIVYANDLMAVAGAAVAQRQGLRIPGDLSITGFDGTDIGAHLFPSLTTVRTNPFLLGSTAASSLVKFIDHETVSDVTLPSPELIVRDSTGPAPTDQGA